VAAGEHRPLSEVIADPELLNFSLGTRYRLALSLAESVFFLHLTGWLHKSIRTDNILLSGFGPTADHVSYPRLQLHLVGFNTARLDQQGERSEKLDQSPRADLYHHPDYQCANKNDFSYSRGYDIYSLGVCLLELAMWQPVHEIGRYDSRKHSATAFAKKLQKKDVLNTMNFTVGSAYRRAVEWCLKGPFEQKQSGNASFSEMQNDQQAMEFWDCVVLELANCSVPE
jgi:serine/threonine protein kinase